MAAIRSLFLTQRPIDRPIEKVIDYYARGEERLAAEISEYEVTPSVEGAFRRFIDVFGEAVGSGQATEIGIWVSGFYGSGKSSFTKYLGFALDPAVMVHGERFLDLLCDRLPSISLAASLKTLATKEPTTVIFLDLGAEQLAENALAPVASVLYWKVLQWAGFSKEKKLAQLEFRLESAGILADFYRAYRERFSEEWNEIHNDPLLGVARAAEIVGDFIPEFRDPDTFRRLRFDEALDAREVARRTIDICRRRSGRENILFLVDEAGQYVAPRGELILNLDGLARNLKELGQGRVWIAATGQQTLTEIVERATYNSAELNKLKDRFPISIHLDARDIKEITYRRLLTKSPEGERELSGLYSANGPSLVAHTRLAGTSIFKGDTTSDDFVRLYPFLPQHFDLLLELIRALAQTTGGVGLRSAIRVIQDVLVDKSQVLPPGTPKLADRAVGELSCVDDLYNTLRADLERVLPHVVHGVDKIIDTFPGDLSAHRVAKAVASLQPIDGFPRSAENLAALLYSSLGSPSIVDGVRASLGELVETHDSGVVEDPQSGGYIFLSDEVRPLREKRDRYQPTSPEMTRVKVDILREGVPEYPLFSVQPTARIEGSKDVRATVRIGRVLVTGGSGDVALVLESVDSSLWEERRRALLAETVAKTELSDTIVWLSRAADAVEDQVRDIVRSEVILQTDDRQVDQDVALFLRGERRRAERGREEVARATTRALMEGTLIFRGRPTPAAEAGASLDAATRRVLEFAAVGIFSQLHLAPVRVSTDAAAKFLAVERLDRITTSLDPLDLVVKKAGAATIDSEHPALAELLRVVKNKVAESGSGRLQGSALQDLFSSEPYGWTKDTVRYVLSALLVAGEIEIYVPGEDGAVRTSGPIAIEAFKSTVAFNKVGVGLRGIRPSPDALNRAAERLESLLGGIEVLPLEDHISRAVQRQMPTVLESVGALGDQLRLLGLSGEDRAASVIGTLTTLLRGDASDATGIMGAKDSTLADDVAWARETVAALNDGGEQTILEARQLLQSGTQFVSLFGDRHDLLPDSDRDTLVNAFNSQRFVEQLPTIRSTMRATRERVEAEYATRRLMLEQELKRALSELEATSEWLRLPDDDRSDFADRLALDRPGMVDLDNAFLSLQALELRITSLPGLVAALVAEMRRRLPPIIAEPSQEAADFFEVDGSSLVPSAELRTPADVDELLERIRNSIIRLLANKKSIRIRGPASKVSDPDS